MRPMQATAAFDSIPAEPAKGEPLEIRRLNQPLAFVYPAGNAAHDPRRVKEAPDGLRRVQDRNTLGGISIKSLIEEGRR